MMDNLQQEIDKIDLELFNILLKDHTTNKNICWATNNYISYGLLYLPQKPITKDLITGENKNIIKPRFAKNLKIQKKRTKNKAEVFTPSWVCNKQNNLVDEVWFGRENVFNISKNKAWESIKQKIDFPKDKNWTEYVDVKVLEITCGEAPYLVSRYDTVTGEKILIPERIGLLDRKLRVINENTNTFEEWYKWVIRAFKSTYGYEYQGDNLLVARENLLYTFIEYLDYKFSIEPNIKQLKEIAKIISWNIWQMDGLSMTTPFSEREFIQAQINMFDFLDNKNNKMKKEQIFSKIYDWQINKSVEFRFITKK